VLTGAFLAWGPIGLGNGPLDVGNSAGFVDGAEDVGPAPVGLMVGLSNSGGASAVISSVQLIGARGYPEPRVIALHAANDISHCIHAPVVSIKPRLTLRECQAQDLGSLYGRPLPRLSSGWGYQAVAVLSAPASDGCWAITEIVTQYRVGIRHYAATEPGLFDACGVAASENALNAAFASIGGAPPP